MRANRKNRLETRNAAQVGIGTMIVFIATVLVAAIAAAVLINTSGKLQERSQRTGEEATAQVSSNLQIDSIVGRRNTTNPNYLTDLDIFVSLAPGASTVDLNATKIVVQNKSALKTLTHRAVSTRVSEPNALPFIANELRDEDNSFTVTAPVMTAGDLINVSINLEATDGTNLMFPPRDEVSVVLLPEIGSAITTGFATPVSFGTKTIITLK